MLKKKTAEYSACPTSFLRISAAEKPLSTNTEHTDVKTTSICIVP